MDLATAVQISEIFTEVIIAPEFAEEALELLGKKKNLRLVKLKLDQGKASPWALDLLNKLVVWNPKDRLGATEALQHPYFTEELPKACQNSELPLK